MADPPYRGNTSVELDQSLMEWLADNRTDTMTWAADRAMDFGMLAAPVCAVLCIYLLRKRRFRPAGIALGLAGVGALLAADLLKALFERNRPPHSLATVWANGPAFPSSAAATTMAVVVVLVTMLAWPSPRWRWPGLAIGTFLVLYSGWAVMYLGAHWLTDVLAGWLLGVAIALPAMWAARRLNSRLDSRQAPHLGSDLTPDPPEDPQPLHP